MKHRGAILVALALILALGTGCAGTRQVAQRASAPEPLQLSYAIQYVDQSSIGVELMVMSPELPLHQGTIERGLDHAMSQVARDLPKSSILAQQAGFRDALSTSFRDATEGKVQASLFVMKVYEAETAQVSMK